MEWLIVVLAAGGAGGFAWTRLRAARGARREQDELVRQVRRMAEEDVTVLGEELTRLDQQLSGQELEPAARADLQTALDGYEEASREASRVAGPEDVRSLLQTLDASRYAVACVQARAAGRAVPERRVPCFFNPQHGPSVLDVEWRFPRNGTRRYPACRQCATRVQRREAPEVRTVQVGPRRVPYWEAGPAYRPYSQGYFEDAPGAGAVVAWAWSVQQVERISGSADTGVLDGGGIDGGGFDGGGYDGGGFD